MRKRMQSLPEELARRETLKAKLDKACETLKRAAKKRAEGEREEYEKKVKSREKRKGSEQGANLSSRRTTQ